MIKRFIADGAMVRDVQHKLPPILTTNEEQQIRFLDELNGLQDELMNLRAENTKFKLVVKDIVDDLEQQAETGDPIVISKEYVKWITDNVDLRFNGVKDD